MPKHKTPRSKSVLSHGQLYNTHQRPESIDAAPEMVMLGENRVAPDEIQAHECSVHIKKRLEENARTVLDVTNNFYKLSTERRNVTMIGSDLAVDLLAKRQKDAVDLQNCIGTSNGNKNSSSSQEDGYASSPILLGSSIAVKNAICPIKLPEVKKLPRYITWNFLDRNQRMTEDQSVVGQRRIYYDPEGGEALICSDSEEETIEEEEDGEEEEEEEEEEKKEFSEANTSNAAEANDGNIVGIAPSYLDKDLDGALDSLDNLFCRRCHVFSCRLHGCSQELVFPAEKQPPWCSPDAEKDPCGQNCFRLVFKPEANATARSRSEGNPEQNFMLPSNGVSQVPRRKSAGPSVRMRSKSSQSDSGSPNAENISESNDSETRPLNDAATVQPSLSPKKSKLLVQSGVQKRNSKWIAEHVVVDMRKRQKKMLASNSDPVASCSLSLKDLNLHSNSRKKNEDSSSSPKMKSPSTRRSRIKSPALDGDKSLQIEAPGCAQNVIAILSAASNEKALRNEEFADENVHRQEVHDDKSWKPLEKALYEKGLAIFGRNSCLIARNLLNGWKTCLDIYMYMNSSENKLSQAGDGTNALVEGCEVDGIETMGKGARRRSKFLRRRGKVRRLKYTWKSAGYHHSIRKRISERKDLCVQYIPCTCESSCGKDCPCLANGTCCEKYCGCPKSCKNRFRGCHCTKSQCQSRQCPCFAANRECDPDVCRNCWVSCGDGTLGAPSQRGDNYECRNMKILLKQQQRVLLGRSDISGWGAFLKNSVDKHEYLGEYTGELISHFEASKRGKMYDRGNSSYLFNLNDQFVLDPYRKGNKLKFANHSPNPNCYAKVVMVAGDHRIGIFAKERIRAGDELFYDYCYKPDSAPAWATKLEASGSKKEYAGPSSGGRAKKHT